MARSSGRSQLERSRCQPTANGCPTRTVGTWSITSETCRSINDVRYKVISEKAPDLLEHGLEETKHCSQGKGNNVVTFQIQPRSTFRSDSVCERTTSNPRKRLIIIPTSPCSR